MTPPRRAASPRSWTAPPRKSSASNGLAGEGCEGVNSSTTCRTTPSSSSVTLPLKGGRAQPQGQVTASLWFSPCKVLQTTPPLARRIWPLTRPLSCPVSKAMIPAMSSIRPRRPTDSGRRSPRRSCDLEMMHAERGEGAVVDIVAVAGLAEKAEMHRQRRQRRHRHRACRVKTADIGIMRRSAVVG